MSDFFKLGKGVRQGCILSPLLFNIYGEYIMRQVAHEEQGGFSIGGHNINELRYADDTTLIETAVDLMQRLVNKIKEESEKVGLYLNKDKTKLMAIGDNTQDTMTVDGTSVERVKELRRKVNPKNKSTADWALAAQQWVSCRQYGGTRI